MPELPEVETTRRGIQPWVEGHRVERVVVREPRLRWRVPPRLARELSGEVVHRVERRAKYLLLHTDAGSALLHLGMSGSLRIVRDDQPAGTHDHVDLIFEQGHRLRLRDPRRFGCLLWSRAPTRHRLLRSLGPEPLEPGFDGAYLRQRSHKKTAPVKAFLMDAKVVVGVGNIYASEALHRAGIHPSRAAGRVSERRYQGLAQSVRDILSEAIAAGGTTLRDYVQSGGEPGGYSIQLDVYGRQGEPCHYCGALIRRAVCGQRSTFWCPHCQR